MKPIPVSEFNNHVERLHADRDKLFEMEYEVSAHSRLKNNSKLPTVNVTVSIQLRFVMSYLRDLLCMQ